MIRSIAVPFDGSPLSEAALPVADWLGQKATAFIDIAMVHESAPVMALGPNGDGVEVLAKKRAVLEQAAANLGCASRNAVHHKLLEGPPAGTLVSWLERSPHDLVVMSTHGRGPASRFWLGSVTDHVIRHTATPVLVVRPPPGAKAGRPTFTSGLVAVDLSEESERILEPVADLARVTGARLTLIYVLQPGPAFVTDAGPFPVSVPYALNEITRQEAETHLERAAGKLREAGIEVETTIVFGAGVATTILDQLNRPEFDFVALTTHGAGGFRRMLVGSVADKLIRGASKPVLVVRPEPASV